MSQSRKKSAQEAAINTLSAFVLSWALQLTLIPLIFESVQVSAYDSFFITVIYTALSFSRNYVIRRFFNKGKS